LRLLVLLTLLILGGCTPTLSGQLVTRAGDPIISDDAAVNVTRLDKGGTEASTMVVEVSDSGEFKAELPPGSYLVESFVPDFSLTSQRVEIGKHKVSLRLVLERVSAPAPGSIGAHLKVEPNRGPGGATLTPPQL